MEEVWSLLGSITSTAKGSWLDLQLSPINSLLLKRAYVKLDGSWLSLFSHCCGL